MRVLVAGGAGYIGSHTAVQLAGAGHTPIIADNFANSSPEVINRIENLIGKVEFHEVDLTGRQATIELFAACQPDAVIHFAALKAVGESVERPLDYYETNFGTLFSVLGAMREAGTQILVFSSSATVYGGDHPPFTEEDEELVALSPYGYTKLASERILTDVAAATDLHIGLLRYFNPVGGHPSGMMGEDPRGIPNNLMPYLSQVAVGRRDKLTVFGDDYPTPDGTCLRDYLHVLDLADAHVAALERLAKGDISVRTWNFGTGTGTSVLELREAFEKACGKPIPYEIGPRRAGDRADSWADPTRAEEELGWKASRTIDDMCADAWRWQSMNPQGYGQ